MALFINETTSSLADFVSKLNTFLTTGGAGNPGWSADRHVPASGQWAVSKDDDSGEAVEVAFQWDTATPSALGIYQYFSGSGAGNYNTGLAPYAQAADSGNGAASTSNASLDANRSARIGNTPVQYWCFASETYANAYVVVETADGFYRHFGFGCIAKNNDWTGGSFAYGHKFLSGQSSNVAIQARSCMLLDGLANGTSPDAMQSYAATIRCDNLMNQPASGLWAVHLGNQASGSLGNDRQGSPQARIHFTGGFRAGLHALNFGQFPGSIASSLIPSYPLVTYHWDRTSGNLVGPMGYMRDVRGIMLKNFQAEDTVTIGGDTWYLFPSFKRYVGSGALTDTTGYQGVMYKVPTA